MVFLFAALTACVENSPVDLASRVDSAYFRCRVEPVFDAKCSMLACHGDVRRPFRVFTRNRARLIGTNIQRDLPLAPVELRANFENAVGFVTEDPDQSWLLLKPLATDAGGWFHRGAEIFEGPDVFEDVQDPDYQTIRAWIAGETEDPACVYAGSEAAP